MEGVPLAVFRMPLQSVMLSRNVETLSRERIREGILVRLGLVLIVLGRNKIPSGTIHVGLRYSNSARNDAYARFTHPLNPPPVEGVLFGALFAYMPPPWEGGRGWGVF